MQERLLRRCCPILCSTPSPATESPTSPIRRRGLRRHENKQSLSTLFPCCDLFTSLPLPTSVPAEWPPCDWSQQGLEQGPRRVGVRAGNPRPGGRSAASVTTTSSLEISKAPPLFFITSVLGSQSSPSNQSYFSKHSGAYLILECSSERL